ncbi:hypothetical protein B7755_001330 [Streptomyces sp. NBS 14/10]|uniref:hypothetical protein n=1 Tax=Streptomyces sp. NBS 14/10 TaxID=1945643 RepID=UPI00117E902D|nr:hypothetical protein [Streptomyces sp. NBS 14/10]KAK1176949.1 hypothetical protein B7755_001330 [Streptomyces sp. NBS 14/10]
MNTFSEENNERAIHQSNSDVGAESLEHADKLPVIPVGLKFPDLLSFAEWERAGHRPAGMVNAMCWCLGDRLIFDENIYVDRYRLAGSRRDPAPPQRHGEDPRRLHTGTHPRSCVDPGGA